MQFDAAPLEAAFLQHVARCRIGDAGAGDDVFDVEFLEARPGDFRGREISAAKAADLLGWQASTSFDDGLRRYIDWYRASR